MFGYQVEFDFDEVDCVGVFVEDVLSEGDVFVSIDDLVDLVGDGLLELVFFDDDGLSVDFLCIVLIINVCKLYELCFGELVVQVVVCKVKEG